jgi:hypothetical protein
VRTYKPARWFGSGASSVGAPWSLCSPPAKLCFDAAEPLGSSTTELKALMHDGVASDPYAALNLFDCVGVTSCIIARHVPDERLVDECRMFRATNGRVAASSAAVCTRSRHLSRSHHRRWGPGGEGCKWRASTLRNKQARLSSATTRQSRSPASLLCVATCTLTIRAWFCAFTTRRAPGHADGPFRSV